MPKKTKDVQYYQGVGRRKEAVAQVRLYIVAKSKPVDVDGKKINAGDIVVNGKAINEVFTGEVAAKMYTAPLVLTSNLERFAISILVNGGGMKGQIEAIRHGISRALVVADNEEYRPTLKAKNLLTRDSRTRERRKVGTGGKARRQKQSPKR
ncbi:30S ribosomal protein S9 [Candidatus Roizmanbacteria bacterium]|nr:30S ribosomal protein S9 [Candidatus Roizmanbacteria bacterium]